MTQPDTLHTRLRDEIDRRLELSKAALCDEPWHADEEGLDGGWTVWTITDDTEAHIACGLSPTDAEYIALHDPADAIRRYEGELEVLERHEPVYEIPKTEGGTRWVCRSRCKVETCVELRSLASRLGVSVDG